MNAYQCDIGRISGAPEDSIRIIDPKKVWRKRNRVRRDEAANRDDSLRIGELSALYFDDRKDKTYVERSSDVAIEVITVDVTNRDKPGAPPCWSDSE